MVGDVKNICNFEGFKNKSYTDKTQVVICFYQKMFSFNIRRYNHSTINPSFQTKRSEELLLHSLCRMAKMNTLHIMCEIKCL